MIVLSESILLAPLTNPLNTPIFGLDNLVRPGNVSVTGAAAGFPAENVANPATHLRWKAASGASDQFLHVVISQIDPVDYIAVAAHNLGSRNCQVSVEGANSTIGSPPVSNFNILLKAPFIPPLSDDPLLIRFEPQSLIEIRLKMHATRSAPFVGVLHVGKLLVTERGTHTDHVPINFGRVVRVTNAKSENGQFLGRIVLSEARQTSFAFRQLRDVWYREQMDPFIEDAKDHPFFFAWTMTPFRRWSGKRAQSGSSCN